MEYSIGKISKITGLSISTLRFYDNQGLFTDIKKENGQRKFSEKDFEIVKLICWLKDADLSIEEIKNFIMLYKSENSNFNQKSTIFSKVENFTQKRLKKLKIVSNIFRFKMRYYDEAEKLGSENKVIEELEKGDAPRDFLRFYRREKRGKLRWKK